MKYKREKLLPILQSSLPPFDRMLPYLETIEKSRCHSNFGKLFRLFEARMAEFFSVSTDEIALVCNGTLGLVSALMALEIPRGKYCLMPTWTFSASPASALCAGLIPYFLDVDRDSQTLTPDIALQFIQNASVPREAIGALMVVSPFGGPLATNVWDQFTKDTGIPVIFDAAAAFDSVHRISSMQITAAPMMVSLHATKIFGIGEGGMLLSKNTDLIKRVKGISNFGFNVSRMSSYAGMNAKMSEYQAAIGLGVLDSWQEIRAKRLTVTQNYIDLFTRLNLDHWLSTDWLTNTCNVLVPGKAPNLRDYLLACNIESRIWWGNGCHTYPAYQSLPCVKELPNTKYLSQCMVGLPFSIDTSRDEIEAIGACISDCLELGEAESTRRLSNSL